MRLKGINLPNISLLVHDLTHLIHSKVNHLAGLFLTTFKESQREIKKF